MSGLRHCGSARSCTYQRFQAQLVLMRLPVNLKSSGPRRCSYTRCLLPTATCLQTILSATGSHSSIVLSVDTSQILPPLHPLMIPSAPNFPSSNTNPMPVRSRSTMAIFCTSTSPSALEEETAQPRNHVIKQSIFLLTTSDCNVDHTPSRPIAPQLPGRHFRH